MPFLPRHWVFSWLMVLSLIVFGQFWLLDIRQVVGRSMEPTLHQGKIILTFRWAYGLPFPMSPGYLFRWGSPQPGDLVVFQPPTENNFLVKRVAKIYPQEDRAFLLGDNRPLSLDSREFGPIQVEEILGKVLF